MYCKYFTPKRYPKTLLVWLAFWVEIPLLLTQKLFFSTTILYRKVIFAKYFQLKNPLLINSQKTFSSFAAALSFSKPKSSLNTLHKKNFTLSTEKPSPHKKAPKHSPHYRKKTKSSLHTIHKKTSHYPQKTFYAIIKKSPPTPKAWGGAV